MIYIGIFNQKYFTSSIMTKILGAKNGNYGIKVYLCTSLFKLVYTILDATSLVNWSDREGGKLYQQVSPIFGTGE